MTIKENANEHGNLRAAKFGVCRHCLSVFGREALLSFLSIDFFTPSTHPPPTHQQTITTQ